MQTECFGGKPSGGFPEFPKQGARCGKRAMAAGDPNGEPLGRHVKGQPLGRHAKGAPVGRFQKSVALGGVAFGRGFAGGGGSASGVGKGFALGGRMAPRERVRYDGGLVGAAWEGDETWKGHSGARANGDFGGIARVRGREEARGGLSRSSLKEGFSEGVLGAFLGNEPRGTQRGRRAARVFSVFRRAFQKLSVGRAVPKALLMAFFYLGVFGAAFLGSAEAAEAVAPLERDGRAFRVGGVGGVGGAFPAQGEGRGSGYGSRIRRGRPGQLWFGTFEAWCLWRPDGSPQASGLQPRVWAAGSLVPTNEEVLRDCFLEFEASRPKVPPSLSAVVGYFQEALGEVPVSEAPGRVRFERWEGFPWGASWRRCILSGAGGAVCLEWWANDDFGMSELREFFEAPFFELGDSLLFHQWLGEGGWHQGELRGARVAMGVVSRGDSVYVRIRWMPPRI